MSPRILHFAQFTLTWLLMILGACPLNGQTFKAPQHDARVVVGLAVPEQEVQRFYDVYYGHNIRLGEAPFYCGDPMFLVHVNVVPELHVYGQYPGDGNFAALIRASTGINAKVYEK